MKEVERPLERDDGDEPAEPRNPAAHDVARVMHAEVNSAEADERDQHECQSRCRETQPLVPREMINQVRQSGVKDKSIHGMAGWVTVGRYVDQWTEDGT